MLAHCSVVSDVDVDPPKWSRRSGKHLERQRECTDFTQPVNFTARLGLAKPLVHVCPEPRFLALYAIDSIGLLLSLIALKLNPS